MFYYIVFTSGFVLDKKQSQMLLALVNFDSESFQLFRSI